MSERLYDIAVIGAGVVGCALARRLSQGGFNVLVLEKHDCQGLENSQNNSGVIHSGIHMNPKTVPQKARLCRIGSAQVIDFCQSHAVTYQEPGMYIVVTRKHSWGLQDQFGSLVQLFKNALRQRVRIQFLSGKRIAQREPEVSALFGIRIPNVAVIDARQFVDRLVDETMLIGQTEFVFGAEVIGLTRLSRGTEIETTLGKHRVELVINAAGLYADRIAALGGYNQYQHFFYRGEYWEIDPSSGIKVSAMVYPVKRKKSPGLGVHITPNCYGRLYLGPNAVRVDSPEDYTEGRATAAEFQEDVSAFLPRLRLEHLKQSKAPGIRPKLTDGKTEDDFMLAYDWLDRTKPSMINLIGIESPGLTASLALADQVAEKVRLYFGRH